MNIVDRALQPYSGFRLLLNLVCLVILSIYIISGQRFRTGALIILLIGAVLTVRQHFLWRQSKKRNLDKEAESHT